MKCTKTDIKIQSMSRTNIIIIFEIYHMTNTLFPLPIQIETIHLMNTDQFRRNNNVLWLTTKIHTYSL